LTAPNFGPAKVKPSTHGRCAKELNFSMSLPEFKVGPFDIAPVFLVKDVVKSAEYYRDFLGFLFDRYWGDPPDFVLPTTRWHRDHAQQR
jgi:hypothetical protein